MLRKLALIALLLPLPAVAEVVDAGPSGFKVVHEVEIAAERAVVWQAALDVGSWWSDDHTISGDARRMSIDPRPQGCFCEMLSPTDGIVHLTVTTVSTNSMLRLTGGLGPLGVMGASGNLIWEFTEVEGATRVTFTYAVGGYYEGGIESMAEPVDFVIGEALLRLHRHIASSELGGD
ncbi:MAG: SRPBCC domain-containing protein [Woeseiaceae bacterium]|nr:SRPBCC domain-containing protein [Woeseiaceae bacterium]